MGHKNEDLVSKKETIKIRFRYHSLTTKSLGIDGVRVVRHLANNTPPQRITVYPSTDRFRDKYSAYYKISKKEMLSYLRKMSLKEPNMAVVESVYIDDTSIFDLDKLKLFVENLILLIREHQNADKGDEKDKVPC